MLKRILFWGVFVGIAVYSVATKAAIHDLKMVGKYIIIGIIIGGFIGWLLQLLSDRRQR